MSTATLQAPPAAGNDSADEFVGQWQSLISTTNWEKGRIISAWRAASIDAGNDATNHSDEVWASRVGGVTAPHVGRLRRVHDRFGEEREEFPKLSWTHFLAALDWEDAPMWLQGAADSGWSVASMRMERWEAAGADPATRPGGPLPEADIDEDVPVGGDGDDVFNAATGDFYDDDPAPRESPSGPSQRFEEPDFGDEDHLAGSGGASADDPQRISGGDDLEPPAGPASQPFAGLPMLPPDLDDVMESLKLAILRHKSADFVDVSADTVRSYLSAMAQLID